MTEVKNRQTLKRLADRVTNICERTVFVATGEMIEFGKHLTVYKS